jgi:alkanesulfonate monooxygenase SsuD/methylene tetrahydromethanopterin reductase-like flavin-dependent oxidoreductase (luciferase family)
VRLGLVAAAGHEPSVARAAETHGLFGVLAGMGDPMTAINAAVYAMTATEFVRVAVRVRLGLEHPVTIAEELAVLDNVGNGRSIVLVDTGDLADEAAQDEVALLREALGNRALRHEGPRWKAPAGLPANANAPRAIAVTPKPAQLEVPFWVTGPHATAVATGAGIPVFASEPPGARSSLLVQPGMARLEGDLKHDRDLVTAWAEAGATHVFLELPARADLDDVMTVISRHLAPEVAMPYFPRVMSQSRVPLAWPGES